MRATLLSESLWESATQKKKRSNEIECACAAISKPHEKKNLQECKQTNIFLFCFISDFGFLYFVFCIDFELKKKKNRQECKQTNKQKYVCFVSFQISVFFFCICFLFWFWVKKIRSSENVNKHTNKNKVVLFDFQIPGCVFLLFCFVVLVFSVLFYDFVLIEETIDRGYWFVVLLSRLGWMTPQKFDDTLNCLFRMWITTMQRELETNAPLPFLIPVFRYGFRDARICGIIDFWIFKKQGWKFGWKFTSSRSFHKSQAISTFQRVFFSFTFCLQYFVIENYFLSFVNPEKCLHLRSFVGKAQLCELFKFLSWILCII